MANYRYNRYQYETSPRKLEPIKNPKRNLPTHKKTTVKNTKKFYEMRCYFMKITSIVVSSMALLISGCALALSIISLVHKTK